MTCGRALLPLAEGYRVWLDDELLRISDPDARLSGHEPTVRDVIAQAKKTAGGHCGGDRPRVQRRRRA